MNAPGYCSYHWRVIKGYSYDTDVDKYWLTCTCSYLQGVWVFADWQDLGIAKDLVFVPDIYNWDVNKDFTVNVFDNIIVGNSFGSTGPRHWIREDVNEDCCVSVFDMIVIGNHFGDDYTGCSNGYEDSGGTSYP
jgi:hypothetical protein